MEKTIARQLREVSPRQVEDVLPLLPDLYPLVGATPTEKKGFWNMNIRESFQIEYFMEEQQTEPEDGVCGIYFNQKGEPSTLFRADTADMRLVQPTATGLSEMVLEQRKWFAWPPKQLIPEASQLFYGRLFRNAAFCISLLVGLDVGADVLGSSTELYEYTGFVSRWLKFADAAPDPNMTVTRVLTPMATVVLGIVSPVIYGMFWGRRTSEAADRRRVRDIPEEAHSFLYGEAAANAVIAEHKILLDEQAKQRLHQELGNKGYDVSKEFIVTVYDAMQSLQKTSNVVALSDHLQKGTEPRVPLEDIVTTYQAVTQDSQTH